MSKNNKFWNKDKQVTPITDDAELENVTTNSLELPVEKVISNEVSILVKEFDKTDLANSFRNGEHHGIEETLNILYNYKRNMMDDTYGLNLEVVADWLKIILKRKGYEV